jgi:16S rRNA (guanine1516-N2)-methyltransferase
MTPTLAVTLGTIPQINEPEILKHLCVICDNAERLDEADSFAAQQNLPLYREHNSAYALQLKYNAQRIELFDTALETHIHVDFVSGALAHRQQYGGGRGQPLARAIGLKHGNRPTVLDATAGLARDACILAGLGCSMTLVERSPVLFTLLHDGIRRAILDTSVTDMLCNFMNLVNADARLYLEHSSEEARPEVIYLDPMYPERKKSALVKKDMQILQRLLMEPDDAAQLLGVALAYANKRVVVKRPIHADALAGPAPTTSISSKKTRYDVYVIRAF